MLVIKNKFHTMPESAKSAIIYTLSTLFSRGLAIITVPIFTRLMTTDQIGEVNLYNSWYSMISVIATLSLTSGGYSLAMKEYHDKRDQYQSSVLSLTSLIAVIFAIVYFIAPVFWTNMLGLSNGLIVLMLIGFLVTPACDFWLARQRYEYKYKLSGCVIIGSAILASLLSVIAVIGADRFGYKNIAEYRLYANFFIVYGVAAIIWLLTFWKGKTLYNKVYWKMSLSLSIPLIGYSIAAQILNVSDRMMISHMINNSAVGIYGTLYTVSALSLMFWQAIHASFVPYLFKNIEVNVIGVKKVSSQILFMYALIAVMMTYMAPEIVRVLATDEYYESIYIMPPIAAGVFFTAFANIYSDIAVYYKKTKYVMYPAIIAALANLVLNYIFINVYGYMAAAYTTLFAYILMAMFQGFWARKLCKENGIKNFSVFEDKKLALLAFATTVLCLIGGYLYNFGVIRYLAIVLITICIFKVFKNYKVCKE